MTCELLAMWLATPLAAMLPSCSLMDSPAPLAYLDDVDELAAMLIVAVDGILLIKVDYF